MQRSVHVAVGALLLAGVVGVAAAQDTTTTTTSTTVTTPDTMMMADTTTVSTNTGPWIKSPVFLFMPGVVTANAVNAPAGTSSASGFLLRFQTTIPTGTSWFTPVFGTQWTPNGLNGNKANYPTFFYGAVLSVIQPKWTGGWLAVSIDPLGVFSAGGGSGRTDGTNPHPYGHDFYLEGAAVVPFGSKMMPTMGAFSNLSAYFLMDQQITNIPSGASHFTPVLLYGLALPLAPWGH